MENHSQITFESTLGDLAAHHLNVNVTTLGKVVAQAFHENSDLPGVVVLEESQFVGMISRTTFRELINPIHRKNLYFKSPIKLLLDVIRFPPLQLSEDCTIMEAAKQALSRPKALIYEPIVVCFESSRYCLLDMQVLLAAQNRLLTHAHQVIDQQQLRHQQYDQIIQQEKQKIKQAKRQLKSRHFSIQRQVNEDYSRQKAQIVKQTENVVKLNQKFTRVGQNVYLEAGKAFHSIFINANAIHRRSDHFFEMSQAITKNLDAIHSTSALMSEIVEKVRHLAVQAAVVSYQAHSSRDELSLVNFEIGRLVNQTITAKDKMHTVASQLQFNLREMNYLTTDDTQTTRSMLLQVEQVEKVIEELEKLVNTSLLEQSRLNNNPNACYLIQTIERVLKTKQKAAEELSKVGKK
ncbi:MAG: hypothetical protein WBA77_16435 [Microcoleaceae cyanobacterium]